MVKAPSLFSKAVPQANVSVHSLIDLLELRAERDSGGTAFTFLTEGEADQIISFKDLDRQARAIACRLMQEARPGDRALLLYAPGLDFLPAFFGCLYAKIIAVPAYPPHRNRNLLRLHAIIRDAQPTLILTTSSLSPKIKTAIAQLDDAAGIRVLATDVVDDEAGEYRRPQVDRDTLAFLQYTSGSTGNPKGVMLTHGNLLHNAAVVHQAVEHGPGDCILSWLPVFHDMGFMAGVLQPVYGCVPCVQMSPVAFLENPARWLKAISQYRATASGGPNFAYDLCVSKIPEAERSQLDLSSWTVAFNGAEPVRAETIQRFTAAFAVYGFCPETFYPCYGLAEGTLMVSGSAKTQAPVVRDFDKKALENHRIRASRESSAVQTLVGCGRNLPEQEIAIVGPESLRLAGAEEIGEIWVKGPSVAKGYWNRVDETQQIFNAFIAGSGDGPFLRTGDLGFLQDSELFVTGRMKDLLIIRGQNHYPQDIELTVERCDSVLHPGCGAAFSIESQGEERLAVVQEVANRRDNDLDQTISLIRRGIAENHELVPCAVVLIRTGTIPKTSSGKIQRNACKAAFLNNKLNVVKEWRENAVLEAPSPRVPVESAAEWLVNEIAGKLGIDPATLDVHQPLTAYGLDSLTAIELAHKLQSEFCIDVKMSDLFESLTIADILKKAEAASSPLVGAPQQSYPLSHGQRALWFIHQMALTSAAYNIFRAVRITSALDVAALQDAFQALVDRHASLRTTFSSVGGNPVQQIEPDAKVFFERLDARGWSETDLKEILIQQGHKPFDLVRGPLLRVHLYRMSEQDHVLLMAVHHIVADFWSLMVLLEEVGKLYQAYSQKTHAQLAPLKFTYSDFVTWQRAQLSGIQGKQLREYWKQELAGEISSLNLPTDHPRPPVQTFRGSSLPFTLDKNLTGQLKQLGIRQQTTLFTVMLSAFQVLLHRLTSQPEIIVGSPTAGRPRAEFANVLGYFVNPLPLRADFAQRQTFCEFLSQVRARVASAFAHDLCPFPLMVEDLEVARDFSSSPVFQTMFVFQKTYGNHSADFVRLALGEPGTKMELNGLHVEAVFLEERVAQFDLMLTIGESEQGLSGIWQYNSDLFEVSTVTRWIENFRVLLEAIVAAPERFISELPILAEKERATLLAHFNQTEMEFDQQQCLHQRIEQQVAVTPEQIAVVCGESGLSYHDLNAQANRIARHLRTCGVATGDLVGICMRRSPEMVAAMLAVWKAGAAYVPLDPQYPEERLRLMLDDADAKAVITEDDLRSKVESSRAVIIAIDKDRERIAQQSAEPIFTEMSSQQVAYVIYTSGSTGLPKGVMLSHRNALSFVTWAGKTFSQEELSGVLATTSICFDISIFELWATLSCGGTIVLADDILRWWEDAREGKSRHKVRLINTVPSTMARLAQLGPLPESVCTVNLAGEAVREPLVNQIYVAGNVKRVNNFYGPTETTTYSSWTTVPEHQEVTIGRGVANTELYVLDSRMELVPVGVSGELYIAGAGLAHGYWKHPDWTAERFLPNPFSSKAGERMYRTGDIIRWRTNGELEFLGRADQQVKVRGYRIELEEISSVLSGHPDVRESVVVVKENAGDKSLAAYVGAQAKTGTTEETLRDYLQKRLPRYMVPSHIMVLDSLPKTPNGKIDRKALPDPSRTRSHEIQAPRNEAERKIAEIWQQVLGLKQVGVEDDFFMLGGHSLLATQILARVEERFNIKVSLSKLFESPTIAAMAKNIESTVPRRALPKMKRVARNNDVRPVVVELADTSG